MSDKKCCSNETHFHLDPLSRSLLAIGWRPKVVYSDKLAKHIREIAAEPVTKEQLEVAKKMLPLLDGLDLGDLI